MNQDASGKVPFFHCIAQPMSITPEMLIKAVSLVKTEKQTGGSAFLAR